MKAYPRFYKLSRSGLTFSSLLADYWAHLFPHKPTCDSYISAKDAITNGRHQDSDRLRYHQNNINLLVDAISERIPEIPQTSEEAYILDAMREYIWEITPLVNDERNWSSPESLRGQIAGFEAFLPNRPNLPAHVRAEFAERLGYAKANCEADLARLTRHSTTGCLVIVVALIAIFPAAITAVVYFI